MLRRAGLQGLAALRSYAATAEACLAAHTDLLVQPSQSVRPPPPTFEHEYVVHQGWAPELVTLGAGESAAVQREEPSSSWADLWDGFLFAVPKKKASHRRQRRRLVRYECKNVTHTHPCPACGKLKVRHRLCDDYEKCATVNLSKHRGTGGPGEGEAVEQEGKEGNKA